MEEAEDQMKRLMKNREARAMMLIQRMITNAT